MASITIRRLDDAMKMRLRIQAAHHNRSMEEEAREILRESLMREEQSEPNLAASIRRRIDALGGVELEIPARDAMRDAPELGE